MARSKEQWQAQKKRGMYSPSKSKHAAFQFGRSTGATTSRAPSMSSAVFRLGRPAANAPTEAAAAAAAESESSPALKLDPQQMQSLRKEDPVVIDLVSDDEDDAPEPKNVSENRVSGEIQQPVATIEQPAIASSASDWDTLLEERTARSEGVESDVDEEWPTRESIESTTPGNPTEEPQEGSTVDHPEREKLQLQAEDEDEMEVDEELPTQAPAQQGDLTEATTDTLDRIAKEKNLEDGEIYEEGVVATSPSEVKRAIAMERQASREEAQPVNPTTFSGVRLQHQRGKKQKKRGKKKSKRKLEAMQMLHDSARGAPADFERITRHHPFADAPPPGLYTQAMMKAPGAEPVDRRQGFSGSGPPPPFAGPPPAFAGVDVRRLGPPPPPPMATVPPPFDDSQILRVNRHGNMEMFNGEVEVPPARVFSKPPPTSGGFKYRPVSWSPPEKGQQPVLQSTTESFQALPTGIQRANGGNQKSAEEEFDLDSLRAAALRTKRPGKSSAASSEKSVASSVSVTSSSASLSVLERGNDTPKSSEPLSPEIDELRAEIFRSMMRKRKKPASLKPLTQQTPSVGARTTKTKPGESKRVTVTTDTAKASGKEVHEKPDGRAESSVASKAPSSTPTVVSASATAVSAATDTAAQQQASKAAPVVANEAKAVAILKEQPQPTSALQKPTAKTSYIETTPEFRPLTASSQSVVVRFSLDDGSPRQSDADIGADAFKTNATSMQNINAAIEEIRQKIAQREKQKEASRLSANGVAKGSSSSSASASVSTSPLRSPRQKKNGGDGSSSGGSTTSGSTATLSGASVAPVAAEPAKASQTVVPVSGIDIEAAIDDVKTQIALDKDVATTEARPTQDKPNKRELETKSAGESAKPESARLESSLLESDATSANAASPQSASKESTEVDTSVPTTQESEDRVPMEVDGTAKLDYAAIRREYEQCVTECTEAEERVARLSSEMAQLKKQLLLSETTAGGS